MDIGAETSPPGKGKRHLSGGNIEFCPLYVAQGGEVEFQCGTGQLRRGRVRFVGLIAQGLDIFVLARFYLLDHQVETELVYAGHGTVVP